VIKDVVEISRIIRLVGLVSGGRPDGADWTRRGPRLRTCKSLIRSMSLAGHPESQPTSYFDWMKRRGVRRSLPCPRCRFRWSTDGLTKPLSYRMGEKPLWMVLNAPAARDGKGSDSRREWHGLSAVIHRAKGLWYYAQNPRTGHWNKLGNCTKSLPTSPPPPVHETRDCGDQDGQLPWHALLRSTAGRRISLRSTRWPLRPAETSPFGDGIRLKTAKVFENRTCQWRRAASATVSDY